MTPTNGHPSDPENGFTTAVQQFAPPANDTNLAIILTPTALKIRELIASLEVPFHPSVIEWRVTNTSKSGSPRGQVMPYADQRAYTDRLNALLTPAGWTRRYTVHTSANFERANDKRIVARVLVTCELTIFGLGSHSATGEEWADNDNAGTPAEIFSGTFQHLRLLALDPYDLALSKLERNIQRDRDDVLHLARTVPLDLEVLKDRYQKELRWQLGAAGIPEEWYEGDRIGLEQLVERLCHRRQTIRELIGEFRESSRNRFRTGMNRAQILPCLLQQETARWRHSVCN
jgi:hypothetical protein